MIRRLTTKELLSASMQELAENQPFEKITVKEIAENCGVSVTTFYNHFRDKFELLMWEFNRKIEDIFQHVQKNELGWREAIDLMIDTFGESKEVYINALKSHKSQNPLFGTSSDKSVELFTEMIRTRRDGEVDEELMFDIVLYVKGVSYCVAEWYVAESTLSKEKLGDYLYNIAPHRIKPYLE